jgi:hypothetical protein
VQGQKHVLKKTNRGRHAARSAPFRAPDDRACVSVFSGGAPTPRTRPAELAFSASQQPPSLRPAVSRRPSADLATGSRPTRFAPGRLRLVAFRLPPAACPARQQRLASWPGRQAPRPQAAKPFCPCPVAPTVSRTVSILSWLVIIHPVLIDECQLLFLKIALFILFWLTSANCYFLKFAFQYFISWGIYDLLVMNSSLFGIFLP